MVSLNECLILVYFYTSMIAENRKRVVDLSGEDVFLEFLNHKDSDVSTVSLTSLLNLCMDSGLKLFGWYFYLFTFFRFGDRKT